MREKVKFVIIGLFIVIGFIWISHNSTVKYSIASKETKYLLEEEKIEQPTLILETSNSKPKIGESIKLNAKIINPIVDSNYEYKFIIHNEDSNKWGILQDWSDSNKLTYTIDTIGKYSIYVDAKIKETPDKDKIRSEAISITIANEYIVNEDESIISRVLPETTVAELKQKIQSDISYQITDKDKKVLQDNSKIGTGYKIIMEDGRKYEISVLGDLNGDAKISITDVARLQKIVEYFIEKRSEGNGYEKITKWNK